MDPQKAPKNKAKWLIAVVALVAVGATVAYFVFRPAPPKVVPDPTSTEDQAAAPTPELSYGPPEASKLNVTVSPNVSIEILPSAKSIGLSRFTAFDVSPGGAVIVETESGIVDMVSGEPVFTSGETVRSFAFVGDALAVIDSAGKFGYYADEGRISVIGDPPIPGAALSPAGDRSRIFFSRKTADDEGSTPAIVALAAKASPEVLTGSHSPINTVGGDSFQTYFSIENSLFQLTTPGEPSLMLTLPEADQAITGIAIGGGAVYFATANAVYTLGEGIALPLVVGLGGDIRIVGGSLYVLEPNQRRIYRITLAEGGRS